MKTVSDVAAVLEQINKIVPIAKRMSRLAPETVAVHERLFSKLKLVTKYLMTTQSDFRSSDLLLIFSKKKKKIHN